MRAQMWKLQMSAGVPARVGACATASQHVFIAFSGPQGHGDCLTVAAPMHYLVLQSRDREGAVPEDYRIPRILHDADH